jgi:hypothetical protein
MTAFDRLIAIPDRLTAAGLIATATAEELRDAQTVIVLTKPLTGRAVLDEISQRLEQLASEAAENAMARAAQGDEE